MAFFTRPAEIIDGEVMTTPKEIDRAVKIAAKVVSLYGDTYLPTFDRLYRELEKAKSQESKRLRALEIAMEYSKK